MKHFIFLLLFVVFCVVINSVSAQRGNGHRGKRQSCARDNGGCQQECRMVRGRRQCYCNDGYHLNGADGTCTDIDECFEFVPCEGFCANTEGSYTCSCSAEYVLEPNGGCHFVGASANNNGGQSCSFNNGGCEQLCGGTPEGGVQCACENGFELSFQGSCVDVDECAAGTHNCNGAACVNTVGGFTCGAAPLLNCQIDKGGCAHSCRGRGRQARCLCRRKYDLQGDGKSCHCKAGFRTQGNRCIADRGDHPPVNGNKESCDVENGGCEHTCRTNRRNGKRCLCRAHFVLNDDKHTCACAPGFQLNANGRRCLVATDSPAPIIRESCQNNNGGCAHNCRLNDNGNIVCTCERNYALQADKKSCVSTLPPDPCLQNNGRCDQKCFNNNGRAECSCNFGYQLVNGRQCLEVVQTPAPTPAPTKPPTPATKPPTPSPTQSGCGVNNKKSLLRRIVGGKPADPKDWPWMAAILNIGSKDNFCGGVLITDRHVMTAAHCLVDFTKDQILVRLGEYNFDTPDDNSPTDFNVLQIILHESYNRSSQENDIALMKLDRPSSFSEFIWPVCLPPNEVNLEDQLGYVTGWGTTSFGGQVSNVLQEVIVPVWRQDECSAAYPGKVTSTMMCAGAKAGGKDSCQGDSGGPFLVQIYPSTRWFVIGVVSWGIKCAEAGNPGVYTRVSDFIPWVRSNAVF